MNRTDISRRVALVVALNTGLSVGGHNPSEFLTPVYDPFRHNENNPAVRNDWNSRPLKGAAKQKRASKKARNKRK